MLRVVFAVMLCGCWIGSTPVATTPAEPEPTKPVPKPKAPASIRLELVEGTPADLPDGTSVDVKNVGYMHLADSKNVSMATVIVTRADQTVELGLARAHGAEANKAVTKDALGWRFTLEMADPYQRPSQAIVEATKL